MLADVDGDSEVEIVLASGQVYGPTGELEQKRNKLRSQVVITDQDGDGLLETIGANHFNNHIGLHLKLYIFQETGPATGALPWPTFRRSDDRTGVLSTLFAVSGQVVDQNNRGVAGVQVELDSGQTTVTDASGDYIFGSLPAGDYVVTPSHGHHVFAPEKRAITVRDNTIVETFVMHDPVFDIQGKVLQANNAPLSGVTLRLNSGITAVTGRDGSFEFEKVPAGNFTLAPVSPDLNYLPARRTLRAEDEVTQEFYALPHPVTDQLAPASITEITFVDTQGLPTRLIFPEDFGQQEVVVTPQLVPPPPGFWSTGHAFDLQLSAAAESAQSAEADQTNPMLPVTVELHYSVADLQSLLKAEQLVLFWQSPDGWIEAHESCPSSSSVVNNVKERVYTAAVCEVGTYALFGPINNLFMPSIQATSAQE
jgi:hypothetical protein